MNRNYCKGRRLEWKVRDHFAELGYYVHRSAGSKSPVDLICFPPYGTTLRIVLVQCKHAIPSEKEVRDLACAGEERNQNVCMAWVEGRQLRMVEVHHANLQDAMSEMRSKLKLQKREDRRRRKRKPRRAIRGGSTGKGRGSKRKTIRRSGRKAPARSVEATQPGLPTDQCDSVQTPGQSVANPEGTKGLQFASEEGSNYWNTKANRCIRKRPAQDPMRPEGYTL